MTVHSTSKLALFDLVRVDQGRIVATYANTYPVLDGGACSCGELSYRLVRARAARKVSE